RLSKPAFLTEPLVSNPLSITPTVETAQVQPPAAPTEIVQAQSSPAHPETLTTSEPQGSNALVSEGTDSSQAQAQATDRHPMETPEAIQAHREASDRLIGKIPGGDS